MLEEWKMALALRMNPVHVATADEEKEAIYRFRHEVYVGEQNLHRAKYADNERRHIKLPLDDAPETTIYYVGTPECPVGTMRVSQFGPGRIPRDVYECYSLHLFPDIATRTIAE